MKRYFMTNNVYLLEGEKVYRWIATRNGWSHRDGFKPSDLTDGPLFGAVEISEAEALDRILELAAEIAE